VALLLRAYREWLGANHLHDAQELLDVAADTLRRAAEGPPPAGARTLPGGIQLWLDGFAEMTPQELNLLTAFAPRCERATLAFCLEHEPKEGTGSWLSVWTVVAQTVRKCRAALGPAAGDEIKIEMFDRGAPRGRFANSEVLAHLEAHWAEAVPFVSRTGDFHVSRTESGNPKTEIDQSLLTSAATRENALRVVACANPEAEAVLAAREILRFVREHGARFRDCAVLLRTLNGYHDTLRRVFTRYGIPFFLDRRESVTHHPLAELSRFALRTVTFGWKRDDWFGALKTGLVDPAEDKLDQLENAALAHGWEGAQWTTPLPEQDGQPNRFEPLRQRLTPAFEKFGGTVAGAITGAQLAAALRALWSDLDVERTLEHWRDEASELAPFAAAMHDTVWTQMSEWLDNVERAFRTQALSIIEWLPILESGLAGLSVGAIPPAIDEVLVGSIDRSRNPDLRLALVLGMNETVFPAPPPRPPILTESERELLAQGSENGVTVAENRRLARKGTGGTPVVRSQAGTAPLALGLGARQRLAHERYYGYIACTRARERLVVTYAAADIRGKLLNPSPFVSHLARLFPELWVEKFSEVEWQQAEHASELAAPLIDGKHPELAPLRTLEPFVDLVARADQLNAAGINKRLALEMAERLYANPLATSVSALEDFAACPFRFFLKSGLRIRERDEFEADVRQKGSFQHEVLREFHVRATRDGQRWRDWSAGAARELLGEIGKEKLGTFEEGLFVTDAARQFAGETLIGNLQNLVGTLVAWMTSYEFDPREVELSFGLDDSTLPGWKIDLGAGRALLLRGRIDRLDLFQPPGSDETLAVVVDYKSSPRKLDATKLFNGLELQLLSYLGLLRQLTPAAGLPKLIPAGVFYVGLRGSEGTAPTRNKALEAGEPERRLAFQHSGRINEAWAPHLDKAGLGQQFKIRPRSREMFPAAEFEELIDDVEKHLKKLGNRVLDGVVEIRPYRKGEETACDWCEFHAVCRFDSWTEQFRPLAPPPKAPKSGGKSTGGGYA
jgi:ATP-dependent helicase/nuclease subunit B